MKNCLKSLLAGALAAALGMSAAIPVSATAVATEQHTAAAYLSQQKIMVGNEDGDMMLEQGLTRAQMAALLTRIVANPEHIKADSAFYRSQCSFSDVPEWAEVYVGYCAANHLVSGYGNGLYGPNDSVTSAAACTVMLRCLEDVDTDWSYSTACQTAVELELAPAEALAETEISRGNMAILIYRTMARMGYDVELPADTQPSNSAATAMSYSADGSINVPSDGSRYVPQAGDVIRCDDGSNYAITDVSRWDKNAFSSGPLGSLPEPTCDWSLLPQPELPDAEVRHFSLESGDYLFVRNLYETRRMLYTLYNAIGGNAETWQNGKPILRADGSSKVRIYLSIPNDQSAQSFWPWRESEIVELFDSCPAGSYFMECWDVYRNGVFQRTEYKIRTTT